jgi:YbbR domain-containing protein
MNTRLSHARDRLRSALLEDWGVKLPSLLVAIALWAWVQSGLIVDVRLKADVQVLWPEGLVRYEDLPSTVALTVEGPQAQARRLERERPVIVADLADAPEGMTTVDFGALPIKGIPEGIRVVYVSPPSAEVKLESRYSRRVPVRVAVAGEVPSGYRLLSTKAAPAMTEITGPRSLVRSLSDVPTEPIDLSDMRESRSMDMALALSSRALTVVGSSKVSVSVNVEAIQGERHFTEVPVSVDRKGWKATIDTDHLVLTGPVAELDKLDATKIKLIAHLPDPEPNGRVRLSALGADPGQLELTLPPKAGLKVKRMDPATIQVEREP